MKTNDNFIFGWHFLFPQLGEFLPPVGECKLVNFEYLPMKKPSKKIPPPGEEIPPTGGICKVLNTGKIRLKTIQFEYLYLLRKFPQRDDVMRHAI